MHTCNSSTRETEAGGSLQIQRQPGLGSKFKASLNCIPVYCLSKMEKRKSLAKFSLVLSLNVLCLAHVPRLCSSPRNGEHFFHESLSYSMEETQKLGNRVEEAAQSSALA